MEIFKLDNMYSIVCESESTRYGFRHIAVLHRQGIEVYRTKICYYNRTWESFEYESVLLRVVNRFFNESNSNKKYTKLIYKKKKVN